MRRPLVRLPLVAALLASALAAGAAVVPPAAAPVAPFLAPLLRALDAPVAVAAGDLAVATEARYVVDPEDGVVRVIVDITATNELPNDVSGGAVTRFFYDAVNLGVQPEAVRFRATQDDTTLAVTAERREGYRLVTVRLPQNLYYQQTTDIRLTFDLPGGKPRSSSDVRVGPAFASFLAWAFGDRGTIRVDVPPGFEVDVSGAAMEKTTTKSGVQVFRAATASAIEWFAWINARNDDGLTREQVDLPGGEEIVVRAWPEDTRWRRRVAALLADGVPELTRQIGLPWPVDGPLRVLEIHTPLLEGYAGFYNPQTDEITISEDLDDVTIIHEASHAWFNRDLFTERWITEGLAETYAAQVVDAIGGDAPGPGRVARDSAIAFPLGSWPPPAAIESEDAADREQYGYNAAYRVMRVIVERAGADGMRAVFDAATARTTAYRGEVDPERSTRPNDWRRFLDLTEELADAEGVDAIVARWALTPEEAAELDARTEARASYADLAGDGGTWAAPVVVRMAMDEWAYDVAGPAMATAASILERRDAIASLAVDEGLDPPADLEAAYEASASSSDLEAAVERAGETETSLGLVAAADDAVAAPRDWLVDLGLSGKDPDGDLVTARAAWEAGDMNAAAEVATVVIGTMAVAPDAGRSRAILIGGSILIVLLLVFIVVVLIVRHRSRRSPPAGHEVATAPLATVADDVDDADGGGRPV